MAKRRRKPSKGQAETAVLANRRWCLLDEQKRLETMNHTAAENDAARRRCREFLEGGWGSIDWIEVYGQK